MKLQNRLVLLTSLLLLMLLLGCAVPNRFGMISDPETGLQYGAVLERSFFIDSSQFENNTIKISARNASGDLNYNIRGFIKSLEKAFLEKGYSINNQGNFGIKYDVIIEYSGHIQSNMSEQYAFLGGAAGGIAGYRSEAKAGEAIGVLTGATIGTIIGSYVTDDTFIIIARVTIGVIDDVKKHKKTVTFSSSPKLQEEEQSGVTAFEKIMTTRVAVFAGGRNVQQAEIVQGVKSRLLSIISDII